MLVIGSKALQLHGYTMDAEPNDLDLVGTWEEVEAFKKVFNPKHSFPINNGDTWFMRRADGFICEIEIAWPDSRAETLLAFSAEHDYPRTDVREGYDGVLDGFQVASRNLLYLLKMSHRYLKNSPHFYKTMRDIKRLRELGCELSQTRPWPEFYNQRMADTYVYKHPKLDVTKDSFFDSTDNGVPQKYDHDSIHSAIAQRWLTPAYTFFQPTDSAVMVSRNLWDKCSQDIQLDAVMEESMVLALERSLIPFPGVKTPVEAFYYALMKVCTSITSGWFREFAWESHDEVVKRFIVCQRDHCYTEDFEDGVRNNIVRLKEPVLPLTS